MLVVCRKLNRGLVISITEEYHNIQLNLVNPKHSRKLVILLDGLANHVKEYNVHQFPISDIQNPCGPEINGII